MTDDLKEKFPLCVATGSPVCNDMEEMRLEQTLSVNERVVLKIKNGIEPTPIEEKLCSLPYDLPGEIWKGIPEVESTHFISNKRRFKYFDKYGKLIYTKQNKRDGSICVFSLGSKTIRSNTLVYQLFSDDEVRPIDEKHFLQKQRNDRIKMKIQNNEALESDDIAFCTLNISLPGEEWRPVVDMEDKYHVSNLGRIKGLKNNIILKLGIDREGYLRVYLSNKPENTSDLVHRIVADAWVSKSEEDLKLNRTGVNHKDGNKKNNSASNLEWVTQAENIRHAFDNSLIKIEFTQENYNEAVRLYVDENLSCREIAEKLHFSTSTICEALFRTKYTIDNNIKLKKHKHRGGMKPIRFDDPRSSMSLDTILEIKIRLQNHEPRKHIARELNTYPWAVKVIFLGKRYPEVHLEDYPEKVAEIKKRLGYS